MTTSNKRNSHRNAVMNHSRVQRAVSSVIADQTRAEELLEQLKTTETTLGESDTPKTSETPEDKQPEPTEKQEAPAASQSPLDGQEPLTGDTGEEKFLAAFAAEKTFFKMLINTLSIDEGELYTWLTGLWRKRSSLIKEYRNGNFKAMREILCADEPSFDHALAVKHVVWLLPLVQTKAEEKLAAYGEFAVLLGGEIVKDFLAGFKSNLEARLEARLEAHHEVRHEESDVSAAGGVASIGEIAAMQQELVPVNEKGLTAFELLVAQGWSSKDAAAKARQLKYDNEEARWYIPNDRGFKHYWSL